MTHSLKLPSLAELSVWILISPLFTKDFSFHFFTLFNLCHARCLLADNKLAHATGMAYPLQHYLFTIKIVTL